MSAWETTSYCCIWCHKELLPDETYVNLKRHTVCADCRGMGIKVERWNQRCKRNHIAPAEAKPE